MQSMIFTNPLLKKFTTFSGILYCLISSVSVSANLAESKWQVEKSQDGVAVFTRETPSGYKEVKAQVTIKSTPEEFLALLDKTQSAPLWIDKCRKVELLAKPSEHERIVRSTFAAPWPVKDRDMVTYSLTQIDKSTGNVIISISDRATQFALQDNVVRMQNVSGQWQLLTNSDYTTTIIYQGYGEPAGNLPTWLANTLVVSSLLTTFQNLRLILEKQNVDE
jgi:hypothetical protein